MYQVFSTSDVTGTLYIGLLAGNNANDFMLWMQNAPGIPDTISIREVPIICFLSNAPGDFQVATWATGSVHADKTVSTRWSWGRGKAKLPPTPSFTYRAFQLGVEVGRQFRCVGFSVTGEPNLDLIYCNGQGSHHILMQAQVVQIADMLELPNGEKRKFEPNFPTDACHLHEHNHGDHEEDDSPPPQGKRIRIQ